MIYLSLGLIFLEVQFSCRIGLFGHHLPSLSLYLEQITYGDALNLNGQFPQFPCRYQPLQCRSGLFWMRAIGFIGMPIVSSPHKSHPLGFLRLLGQVASHRIDLPILSFLRIPSHSVHFFRKRFITFDHRSLARPSMISNFYSTLSFRRLRLKAGFHYWNV